MSSPFLPITIPGLDVKTVMTASLVGLSISILLTDACLALMTNNLLFLYPPLEILDILELAYHLEFQSLLKF